MSELKQAVIDLLKSPQKSLERQDKLIEKVFEFELQGKEYEKVAALLKLVGPRIRELTQESIDAITGLIEMLNMDADPRPEADEKDRDKEWNEIILRVLEKKLREAYMVLGPEQPKQEDELARANIGINAYHTIEKTELEREQIEAPVRMREWQRKMILGGNKNE